MPAYFVFHNRLLDPEAMETYIPKAVELITAHGGEVLAIAEDSEVLEGSTHLARAGGGVVPECRVRGRAPHSTRRDRGLRGAGRWPLVLGLRASATEAPIGDSIRHMWPHRSAVLR